MGEAADVFNKALASGATSEQATEFAVERVLDITWPADLCTELGGTVRVGKPWGGEYREVWHCKGKIKKRNKANNLTTVNCPNSKQWNPVSTLVITDDGKFGCKECQQEVDAEIVYFPYDKVKNRDTLVRAVVAYCDAMTESVIRPYRMPDGRIGSELSFMHPLPLETPDGDHYMMSGAYDQIATIGESELGIPEMKTTRKQIDDRYYAQFNPGVQLYTYAWAAQRDLPEAKPKVYKLILELGIGYCRVHIRPIRLPVGMLDGWEREMQDWILRAEADAQTYSNLREAGIDHEQAGALAYPRNVTSCNSIPGAQNTPCPFRDFCAMAPNQRSTFINHNFKRSTRRSPLEAKGSR